MSNDGVFQADGDGRDLDGGFDSTRRWRGLGALEDSPLNDLVRRGLAIQRRREERQGALEAQKEVMIRYLLVKVAEQDWHGVQDAGSDLRDIEAELQGLAVGLNG